VSELPEDATAVVFTNNLKGSVYDFDNSTGQVVEVRRQERRSSSARSRSITDRGPKYTVIAPSPDGLVEQFSNKCSPFRRASPGGSLTGSRRGERADRSDRRGREGARDSMGSTRNGSKQSRMSAEGHLATLKRMQEQESNSIKPSPNDAEEDDISVQEERVIRLTLFLNFFLAAIKTVTFVLSLSMSILASLVDSIVDLGAQSVLYYSNTESRASNSLNPEYPAGRSRIEPVGVVIAAAIMGMASIEVVRESFTQLITFNPSVDMTISSTCMLIGICIVKLAVWRYSKAVADKSGSGSVEAIAMDNFNDCLSNFGALMFANLASNGSLLASYCEEAAGVSGDIELHHGKIDPTKEPALCSWLHQYSWTLDPGGAILISVYIIYSWVGLGVEQVQMLVGKSADTDFLEEIQSLAETHAPEKGMFLDKFSAYHFGPKFLVEVEMVMPENTPLRVSHDCGVSLQHQVESLPQVERCFVHIDYSKRVVNDHDPSAPLYLKTYVGSPMFSDRLQKLGEDRVEEETSDQSSIKKGGDRS